MRKAGGGVYEVALENGRVVEASLRGRLKHRPTRVGRVVIGDHVGMEQVPDGAWTIENVLPRTSQLVRAEPGGRRPRVLAANVDRMIAVVAARQPDPRRELIDRLMVVAESNALEPVLVVNKVDLEGARDTALGLREIYRRLGYRVFLTSAVTGEAVPDLRSLLGVGTSALVGPSGAGKSSLLNAVEPGLGLRTGELSRKRGTGRHTTVASRLLAIGAEGLVADTPGFNEVALWAVDPADLDGWFPELAALRQDCHFRGCTHLHEPGCAVRDALDLGDLDPVRFASYRTLVEEAHEADRP